MPKPPPAPEEPRWGFRIYRSWPDPDVPPPENDRDKYPWEYMEPGDTGFMRADSSSDEIEGKVVALGATGRAWCARNRPEVTVRVERVRKGIRIRMIELPEGS